MKQSRAYQLMDAAAVVQNLKSSTIVELPANEAQARPLVRLEPEQQVEVWEHVASTGTPTAARVEQAASHVYTRTRPSPRVDRDLLAAAKHRLLTAALALLADSMEYVSPKLLDAIPSDAAEEAGYKVLESSFVDQLARKLAIDA